MSPRSLLLLSALLLAALASAQLNMRDLFVSYWVNSTSLMKLCAIDAPSRCYYVPHVDDVDTSKTLVIITYRCGASVCSITNPIGDYYLLRYVASSNRPWHVVDIPRPGLLYSTSSFSIGPAGSSARTPSASYTVCGRTYQHAYYVSGAGSYNITPFRPPYYIVDLSTCREYRIAAYTSQVVNITTLWYSLYIATMYPDVFRIYYANRGHALNGTLHAYFTYFYAFLAPPGQGFYILGPYVAPTLVMPMYYGGSGFYSYRGPVAYDVWRNYRLSGGAPGNMYIHYNIGWPPGDGFFVAVLLGATAQGLAELAYIAENSTGYFMMRPISAVGGGYALFSRRYDVVHVALKDAFYVYDTRGIACPIALYNVGWALNRLDRTYEIEICNNRTDVVIVGLSAEGMIPSDRFGSIIMPGYYVYMYADVVKPRNCTRLRWDAAVAARPHLRVFVTPQDMCGNTRFIISTTNYNPGWRYNLVGNSLVPVGPISPDYSYALTWLDLLKYLSQLYNLTLSDLLKALNATKSSNATKPFNLTNIFSMRQFLGTIRMDSATSTWLRATLNELQKWRVVGAPAGGAVSASLQAPSALAASAAAVAVATAWAASRRSLATAAFLAGFAILATALFTAALYGATVTAALVVVGVMLMAVGAATAWQKQTGEE